MTDKKETLFIVHQETGQRYPLKGDVVIGRHSGDLVFTRDQRLSQQHCRITPTDTGVYIFDLNSGNGTFLNGKRIAPDKATPLQPGSEFGVGDQVFTLQTVSVKTTVHRRKKKRKPPPVPVLSYLMSFVLLIVAGVAFYSFFQKGHGGLNLTRETQSPRDLSEAFEEYGNIRTSVERDILSPKDAAARIQGRTLLKLKGIRTRLAAQAADSPRQQSLLDVQMHYAEVLTKHAEILARALVSDDANAQDQMDEQEEQLNRLVITYRELLESRSPASQALPSFIQSPLQIVEKEFRRALLDYQTLGSQVHDQKVSDAQMAMAIRNDLLPKLNAVLTRMGALQPETPVEKNRLQYEQKLVSAFLGQLKSLALFAETKDAKYNSDVERWTLLIEKIKGDFKKAKPGQLNR